ncbi:aspartate aminotransferase family protein [Zavarzinia sp.]|uniref:aspartate aminotransferase family protein n=1 Tax=Zavarzinia sp. TaxID=2027920 RepID=UPI003BB5EB55
MTAAKKRILALNAFEGGAGLDRDVEELVRRRKATFGASSVLFYEQPLHIVKAEGCYIHTADGRAYLDLYNNVPSVGHCHPRVVAAVSAQLGQFNTHSRYLYDNIHDYAEQLLATFPAGLSNIVFTCTGSESNDFALRLARLASGGDGFVVTRTAYHGNTTAVTDVSPSSAVSGRVAPHVRIVEAPGSAVYGDDIATGFAAAVSTAIADLKDKGIGFAGLLVDTIFSSDGVFADPAGFLAPAVAAAHAAGGLFIADEVQPGFGRTGGGMWGFARHGVTPDVVTMGKPMGNGYPLAGVVTRPDLLQHLCDEYGYFNTFGASPVAAAAGLAVLAVLRDEGLIDHAARVGGLLKQRLAALRGTVPGIGEVRGAGLYLGLDIVDRNDGTTPDGASASRVINALKRDGVLIGAAGPYGHTLKIRPPLCLTLDDADRFVDILTRIGTGG